VIELTIPEALRVVEELTKHLGQLNNQSQQQIRTEKDKQNQKIVNEMKKVYEAPLPHLISEKCAEILAVIVKHSIGKDIKNIKP